MILRHFITQEAAKLGISREQLLNNKDLKRKVYRDYKKQHADGHVDTEVVK